MAASTIDSESVPDQEGSDLFLHQLRNALSLIHDLPRLQSHPLARLVPRSPNSGPSDSAHALRSSLLDAIERMRPHSVSTPFEERMARRHDLLRLRYIEGLDVPQVYRQLSCSRAEYFRQLNAGLKTMAAQLEPEFMRGSGPNDVLIALGQQTPLVGRKRELELLRAAFDASASGDGGRVAMIIGEQGIGKTRLAQELGRWASDQGGLFLEGRWAAWEGAEPYGAVAEALRMGLRQLEIEKVAQLSGVYHRDLARLFPEVGRDTDDWDETSRPSPEEQQQRLYEGVSNFVHNLSQERPILMLLDDLHLAPQMNLQLHLAKRLKESRLLIVYTYREEELVEHQALVAGRSELIRSRLVTDIRLGPLSEADTGLVIAHIFGDDVATKLQASTYEVNHGNPFFVEEMLRYLIEHNAVRRINGRWEVLDATRLGIPESVKLLVEERVARLGDEPMRLLQQAAVLGHEFSFAALSRMADQPEEMLVGTLDRAIAAGVLVGGALAAAQELYRFQENHIREALYQSIPTVRRRRYHLLAGQALRSEYPERLEELAYHFTHGNDPELGASYSYQAAERASDLFTWNRAIPLYRNALDLWEELDGHLEERAAAAENLGNACYKSGIEAHGAAAYLQQALSYYQELNNRYKAAVVHSQLGRERTHGGNIAVQNLARALEHFHQASEFLEQESDSLPLGLVYCGVGMAYLDRLELNESISSAEKASDLGTRLDLPAVVANALAPSGAAASLSNPSLGREALEQGWQTSFKNKNGFQADLSRAYGARFLGVALKDPGAGLDWVRRGPDYDTTYSQFDIPAHLVALHTLEGEFEKAGQVLEELESRMRVLGQPVFGLWPDELGLNWIRSGSWDQADAQLSEAFEWAVGSENRLVEASTAQKLGELYLMSDRDADAERYLTRALDLATESGSKAIEIGLCLPICELHLHMSRPDMADAYLARTRETMGSANDWGAL